MLEELPDEQTRSLLDEIRSYEINAVADAERFRWLAKQRVFYIVNDGRGVVVSTGDHTGVGRVLAEAVDDVRAQCGASTVESSPARDAAACAMPATR